MLKHDMHLSDPEIHIKAWRRQHRDHRWQYRASRSMATRNWTIISLMVQCLAYNVLQASAAYWSNLPHNCSLPWCYVFKNILTRYSNVKTYNIMKYKVMKIALSRVKQSRFWILFWVTHWMYAILYNSCTAIISATLITQSTPISKQMMQSESTYEFQRLG